MKASKSLKLLYLLMAVAMLFPSSGGLAFAVSGANAAPQLTARAPAGSQTDGDTPIIPPLSARAKFLANLNNGLDPDRPGERDDFFYSFRTAGTTQLTLAQAAQLRSRAAEQAIASQNTPHAPQAAGYSGSWGGLGPDPIVQQGRSPDLPFLAMAGRIGALAIASTSPYTMYLGAAQGGVWISSTLTTHWIPKTDNLPSLAIGAISLAPSNENIVYVGTGEGALSGDSYYGNGVLKSTDGGNTFALVSGSYFTQTSISKIAVDPTNPNHLYISTLRGRAGQFGVTPPSPTPYGIYESTNGGTSWTPRLTTTNENKGATDLVIDPLDSQDLYASFWGQGIVKSTDGGLTWKPAMDGLPTNADYTVAPTRFSLGISHPTATVSATLYTGFEWVDTSGLYHSSTIWKTTDEAEHWAQTSTAVVGGYCGTSLGGSQCWYDNVIGVDPKDANTVYALGLFNYSNGLGGVFRSRDGGATWVDLGWHQHPDFHAIAIRADDPKHIIIGNDGGVWSSDNYGGRLTPGDPPSAVDWSNLNGKVNETTAVVLARSGLQIAQFESIASSPGIAGRFYGGTQDNGTLRKSSSSNSWFDVTSGDGGNALVDPYDPNYVYGTYYDINLYRFSDAGLSFFSNVSINNGINTNDRSAFYVPFIMDPWETSRLYMGTFRVYRTDNRGDLWQPISDDLTGGCTSRATSPTGYVCVVTALGATAGSPALYAGTGDGRVWMTADATVDAPAWTQVNKYPLPVRPVANVAVDRSNDMVAYLAYGGFNAATLSTPGHVFKTNDAGQTWEDVSGDLPDVPVNWLVIDPTHADTLYAATDVGPFVTYNGGAHWSFLGSAFPISTVFKLDLNPYLGQLAAATHGRGGWKLSNPSRAPALELRPSAPDLPYGPNSLITYTLTIRNIGNAQDTNDVLQAHLPAHTTYHSGGSRNNDVVSFNFTSIPTATISAGGALVPGVVTATLVVKVDPDRKFGDIITLDDFSVSSANTSAIGSAYSLAIAKAYALRLSPTDRADGARPGQSVTYTVSVKNTGYTPDAYHLTTSGNQWPASLWNASFTSPLTRTAPLAAGASTSFGVKVTVPVSVSTPMSDTVVVKVSSVATPTVSANARVTTLSVTRQVLLVDEDLDNPDVNAIYTAALDANHVSYEVWDLKQNPVIPPHYAKAHKAIVWYTGMTYPGPLLPYESLLASYLDGGGSLFVSGMDILDQAAGTTDFVKNYLHVSWDGTEAQNDKGASTVTGVLSNTVTAGLGPYTMDYNSIGFADYSDVLTLLPPAAAAFTNQNGLIDGLTVITGTYKVEFLAFPFEAISPAAGRNAVMKHSINFLAPSFNIFMPSVAKKETAKQ